MDNQTATQVISGELILQQTYSESGGMKSEKSWDTIKLTPHSDTEVKLTIESYKNRHLPETDPQHDSKAEFVITVAELISVIQKHGMRL
ncbi:MAG: hypothetical protein AABP62_26090 [Planctomycetota bacterium]